MRSHTDPAWLGIKGVDMEMKEIWKLIEGFSVKENWGDPTKINGMLLMTMSNVRILFRRIDPDARFIIHNAYDTKGHATKSQHYVGNATDFHIESSLPFWKQVLAIENILRELQIFDRVGLGIYPDWNNPGFHLDVRGEKARWGKVKETYGYVSFADAYAKAVSNA